MAIGPVQLIVLGFSNPQAHGVIADELKRLRDSNMVRVVDALVVVKDANGETAALEASQLTDEESVEYGALVGGLVGLGEGGEQGMEAGAEAGAEEAASEGFRVFSDEDAWDVMAEIPNGTAAALILLSTGGRSRCETQSPARAGSRSPMGSSTRRTWSRSACSRPRRPRNSRR